MENITSYLNRRIKAVLGNNLLETVVVDSIIVTEEANKNIDHNGLILEAKVVFNPIPGVKHYTYRIDKQQGEGGPGRQRHIHLYYDGKETFVVNADSTAHDGYHQVRIPDEVIPFLTKNKFPVPDNHIIEMRVLDNIGKSFICEDLNYEALNRFACEMGEIIRHSCEIAIIEANVETIQVKCNSKVMGKYAHVNKLEEVADCYISEVKQMLIEIMKNTGKLSDVFDIFDSNQSSSHKLYVAWNEQY